MKSFQRIWMTAVLGSTLALGLNAQNDKVDQRRENQQDRIGQGVQSGSLSPAEAARLESKEAKLNREIRDDREDNGGKLTKKEKAQVNRQQNRLSRQIHRAKHDGPGR